MATAVSVKYSQPTSTVSGSPASIAANMAIFKASEKAVLESLGGYTNKRSSASTTPGNVLDWIVDVSMPEPDLSQGDGTSTIAGEQTKASGGMSPEVVTTACSTAAPVGGSGDPSAYLKTTLPLAMKGLLKHIIASWKGGYDMNAHNTAMSMYAQIEANIGILNSLIPTAIPDGIPACTTGSDIYTALDAVLMATYLKMPQTLTTSEVKAQVQQMQAINSMNSTFSSQISSIVICLWMKIPPDLKLPTAYANTTILIQALTQLLNDWLAGTTVENLDAVDALLDGVQG